MKKFRSRLLSAVCLTVAAAITMSVIAACGGNNQNEDDENKVLTSISVESAPNKVTYIEGEYFSAAGMHIAAHYDNNTKEIVMGYTWTPYEALTLEDEEITISYTEGDVTMTCTQPITVTTAPAKVVGIKVEKLPDKLEYTAGETFDRTGMLVRTVYSDESDGADVTADVSYSPYGALTVNDKVITLSYKYGNTTFTTTIDITVNENESGEIVFGGGVYKGMHTVVLGETTNAYALTGLSLRDWDFNGIYKNNPFKRFQVQNASQNAIVTLDFSGVEDKSEIGFSAAMIAVRAKTLVEVSVNRQNWTPIGFAEGAKADAQRYNSDYSEVVTALRGREVSDPNLYEFYWSLAEFADRIGDDGRLYVRFGYTNSYTSELTDNIGADVIDHISYYDSLKINGMGKEEKQEYTLTLAGEHVRFVGGGMTAAVLEGDRLPAVEFDDGYADRHFGWATENAEEWWTASSFRMPGHALTIYPVFDHDDYVQVNEDGFYYGDGRLHFGEAKKGDTNNITQIKGNVNVTKNTLDLPKTILSDYSTAISLGVTASQGAAFRLSTGYNVEANAEYTITYEFKNVGDADMKFTLHQINSGADTSLGFKETVEIKAGEQKTVTITFKFSTGNGNLLSYFEFIEACSNAKLAINAFIEKND